MKQFNAVPLLLPFGSYFQSDRTLSIASWNRRVTARLRLELSVYLERAESGKKEVKKKHANGVDKIQNSHVSRCSAGLKDDTAGASSVGFLPHRTHLWCFQKHPPTSEEHTLPTVGAQDDMAFLLKKKTKQKKTQP